MEEAIKALVGAQPKVNLKATQNGGTAGALRTSQQVSGRYILPCKEWPDMFDMSQLTVPNVELHTMRGTKVTVLRWEVIANGDSEILKGLQCPKCQTSFFNNTSNHDKKRNSRYQSTQDDGQYKTIIHLNKRPELIVPFLYSCGNCSTITSALASELVIQLPRRVRNLLPFSIDWYRKSSGTIFARDVTEMTNFDIITYEGASSITRKIRLLLSQLYNNHLNDYLDHIVSFKNFDKEQRQKMTFPSFPVFNEWLYLPGGLPGSDVLFTAWEAAYYQIGSAGNNLSKRDYYRLEMQNVLCPSNDASYDHTYKAAKNTSTGKGEPNINMQWELVNGTGEAAVAILTKTPARGETLHALEDLAHRPHFNVAFICTDTWPNDNKVVAALYPNAEGYLGMFHWIKRFEPFMRSAHVDFIPAMVALRHVVWKYSQSDIDAVKSCLKNGTLNGKEHSDKEIADLVADGTFHKRYKKYIHSETKAASEIEAALLAWKSWLARKDPEIDNKELGYASAAKGFEIQFSHISHITIPGNHDLPSRMLPNQKHNLTTKLTSRGEKVETIHTVTGHHSNLGTKLRRSSAQNSIGIDTWNKDRQQTFEYNSYKTDVSKPFHYQQWLMDESNALARQAGMSTPFPMRKQPGRDTGEDMLGDYYYAQLEREKKHNFTDTSLTNCPCDKCTARRLVCRCTACSNSRDETDADLKSPAGSARTVRQYAARTDIRSDRKLLLLELAVSFSKGEAATAMAMAHEQRIEIERIFADPLTTKESDQMTQAIATEEELPTHSNSRPSTSSNNVVSGSSSSESSASSTFSISSSISGFVNYFRSSSSSSSSSGGGGGGGGGSKKRKRVSNIGVQPIAPPMSTQARHANAIAHGENKFKKKKGDRKQKRKDRCQVECTCDADKNKAKGSRVRVSHALYCHKKKWLDERKRAKKMGGK